MNLPTIICDTREQAPLSFTCLPCQRDSLTTGDYCLAGFESAFAIERKTMADLVGSLTAGRDRFMREVDRLRSYDFPRLLIVGSRVEVETGAYRSAMTPRAVLASLLAIKVRGVPVVFSPSPETAAAQIEAWAVYLFRERAKPFVPAAELRELTTQSVL